MAKKIWADDGEFEYVSVQKEHFPGILNVMRKSFFTYENVCIACGMPGNEGAMKELEELTMRAIKDGVSVVAVEKSTSKVVGGAFNKIQVADSGDGTYFENFARNCKYSSSRGVVQFMIDADGSCDLFKLNHIDCLLEIMFLAVLLEYGKKGIATKLCDVSINIAKELNKGKNVKQPLDGEMLPLEPIPKAVSAIFTSFKSQAIGRKLNFTIANRISYDEFKHEGKPYSSKIKDTPDTTVEYLLL